MIRVRISAIDMGRIVAAVDADVMQSRPAEQPTRHASQHPSLGFQRARALVDLVGGAGKSGRRATRTSAEVVVHVRSDGCTLQDGNPVSESTVAALLDDAFVRMLIHDAESRPVNASVRRRHPTTRQRRVVDERSPRCIDCGGTELLEYDHQPPFAVSGRTHTDELVRRCSGCHRRRHRGTSPERSSNEVQ
jgi:hypothetical protein